jgi:hypothetical protein
LSFGLPLCSTTWGYAWWVVDYLRAHFGTVISMKAFGPTSNISIEYFNRPLGSNEISSMLDGQHLYIVGFESGNASDQNRYFVQYVNNESKIEVYTVLFERM